MPYKELQLLISVMRCGVPCRPGFFFNAFSNDAYLQGLADCVDQVCSAKSFSGSIACVLLRCQYCPHHCIALRPMAAHLIPCWQVAWQ